MSPTRGKTPCLVCGTPSPSGSYCPRHRWDPKRHPHPPVNPAYRDPEYRRLRDLMLREWKAEHGSLCPGAPDLGHPPHRSDDLTVDHVVPLRQGGTHHPANLRVLCRGANTQRNRAGRPPVAGSASRT